MIELILMLMSILSLSIVVCMIYVSISALLFIVGSLFSNYEHEGDEDECKK